MIKLPKGSGIYPLDGGKGGVKILVLPPLDHRIVNFCFAATPCLAGGIVMLIACLKGFDQEKLGPWGFAGGMVLAVFFISTGVVFFKDSIIWTRSFFELTPRGLCTGKETLSGKREKKTTLPLNCIRRFGGDRITLGDVPGARWYISKYSTIYFDLDLTAREDLLKENKPIATETYIRRMYSEKDLTALMDWCNHFLKQHRSTL